MPDSFDRLTTSRIPFAAREGLNVWPNGARMAVLVYTAPEEWQWDEREPYTVTGAFNMGDGPPSASTRTAIGYGYEVGLHRLCEVYRSFGTHISMLATGNAIEQHREVIEMVVADGHELTGHGYSEGRPMTTLSGARLQDSIDRSIELIRSVTGADPKGWICPGADASDETLHRLAATGFEYDADLQDDELPYFLHAGDRTMVSIPYRKIGNINDLPLFTRAVQSLSDGIDHLKQRFDAHYREAERRPLLFNFGTHPHISGRADYAYVLAKFLEHVYGHDDVWVTNYGEINAWWRSQFLAQVPPGGGDFRPS